MATFMLVHGAWHGAWCWAEAEAELRRRGHETVAFDLPGHGAETLRGGAVTMDDYVHRVVQALDAAAAPVVLVGHSMGGMPVSAAAGQRPDRVARLVYLCAFAPRDGESLLAIEGRNPRPTVPPALVVDAPSGTATIPEDRLRDLFYGEVDGDLSAIATRLTPQPLAPFEGEVVLGDGFAAVPRSYVACLRDGAISIELQRDMIAAAGIDHVIELDADHSPFLSDVAGLADALEAAAAHAD